MPKYPLCLWNFPSARRGTCCCSGLCFTLTTFVRGRGAQGWSLLTHRSLPLPWWIKMRDRLNACPLTKDRERSLSTEPGAMSSDLASKMPALQGANNHSSPQGAFNELNHSPSPALHHSQATATAGFSRCPLWQKAQWLSSPASPSGLVSPLWQECQSFGSNKARRGQEEEKSSDSGLGICGLFFFKFLKI